MKPWLLGWCLCLAFGLAVPAGACDANLVEILSGASPDQEFNALAVQLASLTRGLGLAVNESRPFEEPLIDLMKGWLKFSNRYAQTPPEYAKKDPEWSDRMRAMADQVGVIRQALLARKLPEAHENILNFSGKLARLFTMAELTGAARSLFALAQDFDRLQFCGQNKDVTGLGPLFERLTLAVASLTGEVPEPKRKAVENLSWRIGQLRGLMIGPEASEPFSPQNLLVIGLAREEFSRMNEILSNP